MIREREDNRREVAMRRFLLSLAAGLVGLAAGPALADDDGHKKYRKWSKDQQKREREFHKKQQKREDEYYREQRKRYEEWSREETKRQREYFKERGKHGRGYGDCYPAPGYFPPQGPSNAPGPWFPRWGNGGYLPSGPPSWRYPGPCFEPSYPPPRYPFPLREWDDDDDDD